MTQSGLLETMERSATMKVGRDKRLSMRGAKKTSKPQNSVKQNSPQEQSKTKGTVLFIGDFLLTYMSLRRVFESAGYTVVKAENRSEALERLETYAIDLVIADIKMDDAAGLETVRWICFNTQTANILMVMYTVLNEMIKIAKELGVQGLLKKPIKPQAVQ